VSRPSFDLKLDRAEQHLVELEHIIAAYTAAHPYGIFRRTDAGVVTHRFEFTRQPGDEVGVLVGEIIYNVRSALDHVRGALVPKKRERDGYFPIYFPGVWEPSVDGESEQRKKARQRWEIDTRDIHPDAVAVLQRLQDYATDDDQASDPPALTAINRIAIKDRHTRLPVIAAALLNPSGGFRHHGTFHELRPLASDEGLRDGTDLPIPEDAVDVSIAGTPSVMVRVSADEIGVRVPDALRDVLLPGSRQAVEMLRPFFL